MRVTLQDESHTEQTDNGMISSAVDETGRFLSIVDSRMRDGTRIMIDSDAAFSVCPKNWSQDHVQQPSEYMHTPS